VTYSFLNDDVDDDQCCVKCGRNVFKYKNTLCKSISNTNTKYISKVTEIQKKTTEMYFAFQIQILHIKKEISL